MKYVIRRSLEREEKKYCKIRYTDTDLQMAKTVINKGNCSIFSFKDSISIK